MWQNWNFYSVCVVSNGYNWDKKDEDRANMCHETNRNDTTSIGQRLRFLLFCLLVTIITCVTQQWHVDNASVFRRTVWTIDKTRTTFLTTFYQRYRSFFMRFCQANWFHDQLNSLKSYEFLRRFLYINFMTRSFYISRYHNCGLIETHKGNRFESDYR